MLAGWFLDVFIEYLFRVIARFVRARGSAAWIVCKATVMDSMCPPKILGCSLAEVTYKYTVDGELYEGMDQVPFWGSGSAERHVAWFPAGSEIVVRVNPADHKISIVRDSDQSYEAKWNEASAT